MIELLNLTEVARARVTGALVADILRALRNRSAVGTNLLDIDDWAKTMIIEAGAHSCYVDYAPSFGRGPFGHYICTAVNDAGRGYRLRPGLLLALEPWVMADTAELAMDADGWTLRSATGCRTAHSEHTIAITAEGAEVLTLPTG